MAALLRNSVVGSKLTMSSLRLTGCYTVQAQKAFVQNSRCLVSSSAVQQKLSGMDLTRLELAKDVSGRSHWLGERVLCVGLLGILPAAVVAPGMTMDMTIAVAFQVHNHMGIDCVLTDYIHFDDKVLTAIKGVNWIFGIGGMGGLIYFNMNDVGICGGLAQLWGL